MPYSPGGWKRALSWGLKEVWHTFALPGNMIDGETTAMKVISCEHQLPQQREQGMTRSHCFSVLVRIISGPGVWWAVAHLQEGSNHGIEPTEKT